MSAVKPTDILFRTGGVTLLRYGRPFIGYRRDGSEPESFTFTRADSTTCSTIVDADLTIRNAAAGKLRCSWYDTDSDGVADVCGLLLESSRANLCLQSEDFATTWSDIGTPTLSAGALTCGVLSLALLGDDSGAAAEGKRQTFAGGSMTGDAVKAFSVFVSKGSSAAAGGSVIQFTDTSAVADRLYATVTWSGTVPSVLMATGTLLRTVRLASNIYRLEFQTSAVTAANAHRIDLYPATTAAQTGNLYVGGVMLENGAYPSSYIRTTTVAVTRSADALSFPVGFPPEALTLYAKVVRPAYADASGTVSANALSIFTLGGTTSPTETWLAMFTASARTIDVKLQGGVNAIATQNLPAGATISLAAQLTAPPADTTRLDVGSGYGSYSSANVGSTAWTSNLIYVGGSSVGDELNGLLLDLIILRGSFTLAEAAATPTP